MKKISNILWGFFFIIIGLILGLNALELTSINIFFEGWWTLFIIVPCFIGLFDNSEKIGNIIGIVIGILLLLCCQGLFAFDLVWKLILPFIFVMIGLSFIFKGSLSKKIKKIKKNDSKTYYATFSGQRLDFANEKFEGCELNAVFGGITCDLRNAKLDSDVVITASSIFGGIDIYVPSDVQVKVSSTSIFGGVDNKYKKDDSEKKKTVYIEATCIFGGVEVK